MKLRLLIISRPISFSILVVFVVLILPSLLIPCWYGVIKQIYSYLMNNYNAGFDMPLEIEKVSTFLRPINMSVTNFARILSSSFNGTQISFFEVKSKIAPLLFEGFSIIPYLTQISYIGMDGLFFSYYTEKNQTFAVFANSTFTAKSHPIQQARKEYIWLTQLVNRNTGQLYGNMSKALPLVTSNTSWFQEAMNRNHGCASIGTKWSNDHDYLFLNTARINGSNGVISLGFSVEAFVDFLTSIEHQGRKLYLATMEGELLVQGLRNVKMVLNNGSASFQLLKPNGDQITQIGNVSCLPRREGIDANASFNILSTNYIIHCSPLEILGVQLVYVLVLPQKGLASLIHKSSRVSVILLILIMATTIISILTFVFTVIKAAKREMCLCAKLIQQMESTRQAERKSMNKSVAFASASHDIRASLAGIIGLIEICHDEAVLGSELNTNLKQMDDCTRDLLGILNSVLDTSKIEAGKIQLEEEEFHLGQLLEDVVDLYHPLGMKKGIDVVLDPCDGSVIKFSQVKGDKGKLKQVLCNLLSNAVKFTSEGHVTVRARVEKLPSLQNKMMASNQNGEIMKHISFLFCNKSQVFGDLQDMNDEVHLNLDRMEYIFEIDDTGKGIPKEKRKLVFENYVQVRETALGQGGTGLGLGIVQSLVRLMGGDVSIVDKEIGEKGTCVKFSVLLTISETMSRDDIIAGNIRSGDDTLQTQPISRMTFQIPSPSLHSPEVIRTSSPKIETSRVILLLQNDLRRMITVKFMESLGVRVLAMKQREHLFVTLQKILDKQNHSWHCSRGKSDMSSPSDCLRPSTPGDSNNGIHMDASASAIQDGRNYLLSVFKKTKLKGGISFILIIIDASAGPFKEVCNMVANFRRGLHNAYCNVVWLLENQMSQIINNKELDSEIFEPNDVVLYKPFHGSRLYEVIRLLPEFGGTLQSRESTRLFQVGNVSSSPLDQSHMKIKRGNSPIFGGQVSSGVQEETKSSSSKSRISPVGGHQSQHKKMKEEKHESLSGEKPLSGKKILVAEDNVVLCKLATLNLVRLGAAVEICENGEEALELVCNGLGNQRKLGASNTVPYDYILMDCEMPIMDGYEATRQIRKMERYYNTHIPIIALTAHTTEEEVNKTIEAGMDVHLGKPLRKENLLEAISYIHSK